MNLSPPQEIGTSCGLRVSCSLFPQMSVKRPRFPSPVDLRLKKVFSPIRLIFLVPFPESANRSANLQPLPLLHTFPLPKTFTFYSGNLKHRKQSARTPLSPETHCGASRKTCRRASRKQGTVQMRCEYPPNTTKNSASSPHCF